MSVHRFQTVVFNFAFGVWFISQITKNLANVPTGGINDIMPDIQQNNLILLGLSSATYAVLKTTENKGAKHKAKLAAQAAAAASQNATTTPAVIPLVTNAVPVTPQPSVNPVVTSASMDASTIPVAPLVTPTVIPDNAATDTSGTTPTT
ncbi:hypothetical protein [Flavobacterium sp. 3HN19-14]|uniref:hypothetical protein n=1 Tax=Flavobacterium sp. 3HN19-14 TaxID=3448133 RepID=UPI003EDFF72A